MTSAQPHHGVAQTAPGWYPDPWNQSSWRWWDGAAWTANISGAIEKKPRLPMWLSVPVLLAGVPVIGLLIFFTLTGGFFGVFLGLVPLAIVVPVLVWLDRVEPEPWSSRLHALLWGVTVAALIASIVNTVVALVSSEAVSAVVSAPIVEEGMKAAGLLWVVRRKEVDGVMDGIVYAGWIALGFAVIEDVLYFATASSVGILAQTFILRAILTPFAHPLFTVWSGIAAGLAISKGKRAFPSILWGYLIAVALHMAWNGSITYSEGLDEDTALAVVGLTFLLFIILFFTVAVALFVFRRREQKRFTAQVPFLAERYGLTPGEVVVFSKWRDMLRIRSSLSRSQRKHFDGVHSSLARLALLHSRPGGVDVSEEQRLAGQLDRARRAPSA